MGPLQCGWVSTNSLAKCIGSIACGDGGGVALVIWPGQRWRQVGSRVEAITGEVGVLGVPLLRCACAPNSDRAASRQVR